MDICTWELVADSLAVSNRSPAVFRAKLPPNTLANLCALQMAAQNIDAHNDLQTNEAEMPHWNISCDTPPAPGVLLGRAPSLPAAAATLPHAPDRSPAALLRGGRSARTAFSSDPDRVSHPTSGNDSAAGVASSELSHATSAASAERAVRQATLQGNLQQKERLDPFSSTPAIPPDAVPQKVRRLEFATPELDEPDDFGLVAQEASSNFGSSPAHALLAGGAAGVVSRTTTAPLDRLKVMLQASDITVAHQYSSLRETARAILQQGGVRAFWRGNGVNVLKAAPEMAVRFYTFERLLDALGAADSDMNGEGLLRRAAAGASAGAIAQFAVYPLETTKTRLAVSSVNEYRGMVHCLVSCVRYEGWRSLYRGLSASLAGIVPYAAVDLTIYSALRELADARYEERGGTPPLVTFGIGALSTTAGQMFSYPLQLVRTRLQAQGMKGRAVVYKGIVDCMAQTVQHSGFFGLYKGMLPNMLKSLPAMSISYTVYEQTKALLAVQ